MPVGARKNLLYRASLPFLGQKPRYTANDDVTKLLKKQYVVGGCVQTLISGQPDKCYCAGYARLPDQPVTKDSVFRTASIAKLAAALLTLRFVTKGELSLGEDVSALLGGKLRNPAYPNTPITLRHLLSHSSGIQDTRAYNETMRTAALRDLLADSALFLPYKAGTHFQYSNLAAGMIGSLLELRFGESFETLIQRELFAPLGIRGTFDLTKAEKTLLANGYRVLPKSNLPAFDAAARLESAEALTQPDPERHFTLASGNLYISAPELCKLLTPLLRPSDFIGKKEIEQMKTPVVHYPDESVKLYHGLGLLIVDDRAISPSRVLGHQGYAYGCVNGLFYNEDTGDGFANLNSGASELRRGHMGAINLALIRRFASEAR